MDDRRKEDTYCPKHGKIYRYRSDNKIICVASGCDWVRDARREEDMSIPTKQDINNTWR